jgi:predicted phosphoribosyltransferase
MALFKDRFDAGRKLAQQLTEYKGQDNLLVLGLPRGGVPVAFEVAEELNAPLDIFLVRKLGLPGHEELAMGAIASGGVRVLNEDVINSLDIPPRVIDAVAVREQEELERRAREYRGDRPADPIRGKTVILVDDGLATGSSMLAAVEALRLQRPAKIVVAVPIAPPETCERVAEEADQVVCAATPEPFFGVGLWYQNFTQTSDAEVRRLLAEADRVHQ